MYTKPLSTIGAELSVPSPVKDHRTIPEKASRAFRTDPLRKKPVEPLNAGGGPGGNVPSTAPVGASNISFSVKESPTCKRPPKRTGVLPLPPLHPLCCQIRDPS